MGIMETATGLGINDLELWNTGGGCTALVRDFGDDGHLMLTNDDGMAPESIHEDCLVCFYTHDAEKWITVGCGSCLEMLRVMAGFQSNTPKRTKVLAQRDALERGLNAFWSEIARCYPEANTGDVSQDGLEKIWAGADCALSDWIDSNINKALFEVSQ